MGKPDFILDTTNLAKYICYKYFKHYTKEKREITPIKLQKSLYFLFAYWGGFVRKNNTNSNYVEENIDLSEYLFEDTFHAWVYGPVIPKIFKMYKKGELQYKDIDENDVFANVSSMVKETVDSLLDELFEISDFKLVSVSHEDECWKRHFDISANEHNEVIPQEEIINEYALRETV